MRTCLLACLFIAVAAFSGGASAQTPPADTTVDTWITATGDAAGTDGNAKDEAQKKALRNAVEQACGVFIKAQSKTKDYQAVYDKVIANTVGYVIEFTPLKTVVGADSTAVTVKARVSTKKFEENWAHIAHTLNQENNPRVVIAISEATNWTATGPAYETSENGTIQTHLESFFDKKGLTLMDRGTSAAVTKRDLLLAVAKDDVSEVAAVGARFKADVVILGRASVKIGKVIRVGNNDMYQYTAALNIRAVQTDSARILMSKNFTKTYDELQQNAEDKVLTKLGDDYSADVLSALVEAWAKRANVSRTVELLISGMDYDAYKTFKVEVDKIRGVHAVRMREITESVATIDIEYEYTNEILADRLGGLKDPKLKVVEINANRIKLKVAKE